jgi:2-oxoglutarate ferredoxin oxidoreductase subunit alpha
MTRETVAWDTLQRPAPVTRRAADPKQPYLPFAISAAQPVPDFLPIGSGQLVRQTSSTHGIDGYITTDPQQIARSQARLKNKLIQAVERFSYFDEYAMPGADTLIVTYGVSARAARAAVDELGRQGRPASLLVLKTLWPVPEALIGQKATAYDSIVVVEMNLGQYVREIERLLPTKKVDFLGQMDGELIKPQQIMACIQQK